MPHSLNTPTLVNKEMNLSTEEKVKILVFCLWQTRDKMIMIKIKVHGGHFYWIVALLYNAQ